MRGNLDEQGLVIGPDAAERGHDGQRAVPALDIADQIREWLRQVGFRDAAQCMKQRLGG